MHPNTPVAAGNSSDRVNNRKHVFGVGSTKWKTLTVKYSTRREQINQLILSRIQVDDKEDDISAKDPFKIYCCMASVQRNKAPSVEKGDSSRPASPTEGSLGHAEDAGERSADCKKKLELMLYLKTALKQSVLATWPQLLSKAKWDVRNLDLFP
jgi:hypothetical protein